MPNKLLIIDEKYNDNDGAYDVHIVWTGNEVDHHVVKNYSGSKPPATEPATAKDYEKALEWWLAQPVSNSSRDCIGCTYLTKGSRKVPNGTEVTVYSFRVAQRQGKWQMPNQVTVELPDKTRETISASCLHSFIKGTVPYWYSHGLETLNASF